MEYKIYQLANNEEGYRYMFRHYRENRVAQRDLYEVVYTGTVEEVGSPLAVLESLFTKFNIDHPADFKGHSLSVSDIVELDGKFYYCDSFGFVELKNW